VERATPSRRWNEEIAAGRDMWAMLMPLVEAIRAHVFAAKRIHADDTTVPVLATGKCRTGRLWTYVRDDRPFAGTAAPAAAFFYSADRGAVHPDAHLASYAGPMRASTVCTKPAVSRARSSRGCAGPMRDASSSAWRGSTRRQLRSKRSNGSMRCSRSSATSTAPPMPPFTNQTAAQKARMAEDTWNTRDPARVTLAYTTDSRWRNRAEFLQGRAAATSALATKNIAARVAIRARQLTRGVKGSGSKRPAHDRPADAPAMGKDYPHKSS
jgi:hypothetical protein